MSADHVRSLLAALALAAAAGCGGAGKGGAGAIPSPAPLRIEPSRGYSGADTPVVITGENFLARTTGRTLDTRHQVWLGETELVEVEWISARELHATVPAGLPSGTLALRVRNAYGREGTMPDAFTVETTAGGALAVRSVSVTPTEVNVGQSVTVTATVDSVGTAAVRGVVASLPGSLSSSEGGGASVTDGPSPVSADVLAPGQSTTFTWTVRTTAAGETDALGVPIPLELPVTASGDDASSGLLVQADARAGKLIIDQPAGLTATVVAGRATADVGQPVPVTFSVTNGGTATADLNPPVPSAALTPAGVGAASCTAVSPAGATAVGPHASRAFTWSCAASAAGILRLSGTVTGTDANTGASLSATPAAPDSAAVQTAAALSAAVSLQGDPAAVNVGQTLTVNLTVSNGGTAAAHVTGVTPTVTPASGSCSAAAPDPPAALAGSGSVRFTWTCTPAATGTLTLGATVTGADDNTGAALAATSATVSLPVQLPAALIAVPSATPTTANVEQRVTVSLLVYNGSGAAADLTAVTPVIDGSSTATATCDPATPAPGSLPALGHATFTWTCRPRTPGTLQLTATVTGTDHDSGAAVIARPAPFPVTVQAAARVAVTAVAVDRSTVDTGQDARVTISLRNSGGADARVTLAPTATPPGPSCGPAPVAEQVLPGGGTLSASWGCASSSAGAFAYGADVTVVDANSGASATQASPGATVTVQTPAALVAGLTVDRTTLDVGQRATVTLTVTNQGGAAASVTTVAPSATAGTGSVDCSAAPAEALPVALRGGASTTFTWTCVGRAVGTAKLGAAVTATDANDGGSSRASATPVDVTVHPGAALTATLTADRTTLGIARDVTMTLIIHNGGPGAAEVTAITPSASTEAVTCPAAPREAPGTIASGGTATFHWTCASVAAGVATLDAAAAAHALDTGATLAVPVDGVEVTVQAAPSLTATLSADATSIRVGGVVNLTLTVGNAAGAEDASVTAVAPSTSGGAVSCPAAAPIDGGAVAVPGGRSATFRWSCSGAAGGSASLGATVAAANAPSVPSTTVTVSVSAVAGVAVTGTLSSSPATIAARSGGSVTLSLTLRNPGPVGVHLGGNAVTALVDLSNAAGFSCHNPTTAEMDIASGGTATTPITWTCTNGEGPVGARTTFGAHVAATDATGRDASASITGGTVQLN